MWKQLREQLKAVLKGERGVRLVVLAGVAGMALILLSGFLPSDQRKQEETSVTDTEQTVDVQAYCDSLEQRLTEILEQIEGVGHCQVMLTADGSAETVYAKDEEQDTAAERTQSQKKCVVISDSTGERALVQQVVSPEISGVIVVCDGADTPVVKERVSSAVQAVLDLPVYRICVVPFSQY